MGRFFCSVPEEKNRLYRPETFYVYVGKSEIAFFRMLRKFYTAWELERVDYSKTLSKRFPKVLYFWALAYN